MKGAIICGIIGALLAHSGIYASESWEAWVIMALAAINGVKL